MPQAKRSSTGSPTITETRCSGWETIKAIATTVGTSFPFRAALRVLGPITLLIFVIGHIVGTTLLGVAALKGKLVPTVVAIALLVSQPLHLVSVIVGLPVLDLFAWGMTALGMAFLAARLVRNV